MSMLKVATANWYVNNPQPEKDAKYLATFEPDVMGIQEGAGADGSNTSHITRALRNQYDVHTAVNEFKKADRRLAALDVPIASNIHTVVVKGFWNRLVSHRAQEKNIGMPRSASVLRFTKNGKTYTHINTHLNAAIKGHNPRRLHLPVSINRVAEYVKSIGVLEAMIKNAKERGDIVIVTGDLNYSVDRRGIWKYSPQGLFKRTHLHYRSNGLDYIAYSHEVKCVRLQTIPRTHTGSDHPWLVATLVKA